VDLAIDAHYRQWYAEDFCRHPALMDFVSRFTGWESNTLGLRRSLLRNNIPGTKPIGVHYDQIFLRHGEPTSVTAWVPIGDIKVCGGGLIYLENGRSRCCHSELYTLTVTFQVIPSVSGAKKISKRRPRLLASQSRKLKMHSTTT
jgi:hypothetical protein